MPQPETESVSEHSQEFGVPVGHRDYGSVDSAEASAQPEASTVPPSGGLRLMAVHAHPDDESSKGAAMMASYSAQGADVMVALCTGGEEGSLLNPSYGDAIRTQRDITAVRREEMKQAAQELGIEYRWLGFLDSGFPEGDLNAELPEGVFASVEQDHATAALVRLIREFRPHVIISYDEIGGYPHPDHIRAHAITVDAYHRAGDPEQFPGTGEAWEVAKLYYDRAFNPDKYRALHAAFVDAGQDSPYERQMEWYKKLESGDGPEGWRITPHTVTTQIPVSNFLEHRDAALRAHRTQIDPEGHFFATPNELLRKTWPWEDYVLIDSRVRAELPETDLFSGLR